MSPIHGASLSGRNSSESGATGERPSGRGLGSPQPDGAEEGLSVADTSPMRRRISSRDSLASMQFSPCRNEQVRILCRPCWRNVWVERLNAEANSFQLIPIQL